MISHLFFVRKGQVAVFAFCDGKLTPFLKDSKVFFDIEENFWDWWQVRSQFKDGEKTDLCFVWDKQDARIFDSDFFLPKLIGSLWDRKKVELVLKELDFSASIQDENGEFVGEDRAERFLTNANLIAETEMYRYYRELNEQRERARQSFVLTKKETKLCEAKKKRRIQGDAITENKEINQ